MVAPASAPPPVLPMTATEAWQYLAHLWDCAVEDEAGRYCVFTHEGAGSPAYSLTDSLRHLKRAGLIANDTFVLMVGVAFWTYGEAGSMYAWPLTEAGAQARANACRIMAGAA